LLKQKKSIRFNQKKRFAPNLSLKPRTLFIKKTRLKKLLLTLLRKKKEKTNRKKKKTKKKRPRKKKREEKQRKERSQLIERSFFQKKIRRKRSLICWKRTKKKDFERRNHKQRVLSSIGKRSNLWSAKSANVVTFGKRQNVVVPFGWLAKKKKKVIPRRKRE